MAATSASMILEFISFAESGKCTDNKNYYYNINIIALKQSAEQLTANVWTRHYILGPI